MNDFDEMHIIQVHFNANHESEKMYFLDIEHAQQQHQGLMDAWQSYLESGTPKIHDLMGDDRQTKVSFCLEGLRAVGFQVVNDITRENVIRRMAYQQRHIEMIEEGVKHALKQKTGF